MRNKKKFNEFMNKTIEELKDEKRYGTAHVYQSTLNAFCEFCGCKIIYFHQLNRATTSYSGCGALTNTLSSLSALPFFTS